MRRSIAAIVLAIGTVLGTALVAVPANATGGVIGICSGSYCWRVDNGKAYEWSRDISGDPNQDWVPQNQGKVTTSWPFTVSSWNSTYRNDSVYILESDNGECGLGDPDYGDYVTMGSCNGYGKLWVYTPTRALISVALTDVNNAVFCASYSGNYHPISVIGYDYLSCVFFTFVDP